jgi:hypothetical protein
VPLLSIVGSGAMKVQGKPGQIYSVEAAVNLNGWGGIDTIGVSAYGQVEFTDVNAAMFQKRFYRLRYPLP